MENAVDNAMISVDQETIAVDRVGLRTGVTEKWEVLPAIIVHPNLKVFIRENEYVCLPLNMNFV